MFSNLSLKSFSHFIEDVTSFSKTLRSRILLKALLWRSNVRQSKRFEETLNGYGTLCNLA